MIQIAGGKSENSLSLKVSESDIKWVPGDLIW